MLIVLLLAEHYLILSKRLVLIKHRVGRVRDIVSDRVSTIRGPTLCVSFLSPSDSYEFPIAINIKGL